MMRAIALAFVCIVFAACSWGEGSPGGGDDTSPDASVNNTPVCGDSVCAASEVGSCATDCGSNMAVCGNGQCETTKGETAASCASDCMAQSTCGNATCEATENETTCPADCGNQQGMCPTDPLECFACLIDMSLCMNGLTQAICQSCIAPSMCSGGAPNGVCDPGETMTSCPQDCP